MVSFTGSTGTMTYLSPVNGQFHWLSRNHDIPVSSPWSVSLVEQEPWRTWLQSMVNFTGWTGTMTYLSPVNGPFHWLNRNQCCDQPAVGPRQQHALVLGTVSRDFGFNISWGQWPLCQNYAFIYFLIRADIKNVQYCPILNINCELNWICVLPVSWPPAVEYASRGVEAAAGLILQGKVSVGGQHVNPLPSGQGGMKPCRHNKWNPADTTSETLQTQQMKPCIDKKWHTAEKTNETLQKQLMKAWRDNKWNPAEIKNETLQSQQMKPCRDNKWNPAEITNETLQRQQMKTCMSGIRQAWKHNAQVRVLLQYLY